MNNRESHEIISRRAFIVGGIKLISFGALISRLGYLQIFKYKDFTVLSDKNRIKVLPIIPNRGEILDCLGKVIVYNKQIYKLILDKEYKKYIPQIYKKISSILYHKTITPPDIDGTTFQVVLVDNLSWDDIARLSISVSTMPGVSIEKYTERTSTNVVAFSHLIGYTADDPDVNVLGYKKGVIGVERELNEELRGILGRKSVEVNVIGKPVRNLDIIPQISGNKVFLSINAELQEYVYDLFASYRAGSCVVMDIFTGEIKSIVSYPGYNAYDFSPSKWNELTNDPLKPLNNRAISGTYPPGSVFKLMTAVAMLESGILNRYYNAYCSHVYRLGDHDFHCWKEHGHGSVNVVSAIAKSCDIFFYNASRIIGMEKIAHYAKLFGFGRKTGVEFAGELAGTIPDPVWKKKYYGKPWYPYETIISAIGQGSVLSTQMQLVKMTAIIANGGFDITPTLVKKNDVELLNRINVSRSTIDTVVEGMVDACNKPGGTAYWTLMQRMKKIPIAGKTGTSQVVRISKQERESGTYKDFGSKKWEYRDHSVFVGFGPIISPRYAVAVLLEHEVSGAKAAAPFGADVLHKIINLSV